MQLLNTSQTHPAERTYMDQSQDHPQYLVAQSTVGVVLLSPVTALVGHKTLMLHGWGTSMALVVTWAA